VVNWNRRELLRACLESLRGQAERSSRPSWWTTGRRTARWRWRSGNSGAGGTGVAGDRQPREPGFCAGNNQGIAAGRGAYVALLNNDAEAGPGWLAGLRRAIGSAPEIGMAASKIVVWEDPQRIDKAGHLIYPDGQNRGRGIGGARPGTVRPDEEVLWPDGCAAMYKRAMLDEIGGFDEDFFAYGDDAELGCAGGLRAGAACMRRRPWCGITGAPRWGWARRGGWNSLNATGCCWRRNCFPGASCG